MAPPYLGREFGSTHFSRWRTRHHGGAVAASRKISLARARACAHARAHETKYLSGLYQTKEEGGGAHARTPKKEIDVQQARWFYACAHEAGHFGRQGKRENASEGRCS
jgi:hypothetical protein